MNASGPPPETLRRTIERGLDNLTSAQLPSGEFSSFATPLGAELDWNPDSSVFVTSLCILALQRVPSPDVDPLVDRARGLLRREQAHGPLWRFWTHDHDRHLEIPCDADDSACATLALASPADAARTRRLLLANRDRRGRFHTWFIPRGVAATRPLWWRIAAEERRTRARREQFWEMTEATPDDVDVVVNANVLRCFGPSAPRAAVDYVSDVVRTGRERVSDSWHRNEFSCWYSVADGLRRGVPYGTEVEAAVRDRIGERVEAGTDGLNALDAAQALSSLCAMGRPGRHGAALADALVASQTDDGGWPRSIFFYGGPKEVFAWGSEDLATASAIAALTTFEGLRSAS